MAILLTEDALKQNALIMSIRPNAVLKSSEEFEESIAFLGQIGLPTHGDPPKNWDSVAALAQIIKATTKDANILDAGAEHYSVLLLHLKSLGYNNLTAINLSFKNSEIRNGIRFQYGDITNTKFPDEHFDAITCLSVLEHGVDVKSFFAEMRRILKPGGTLVTSTDYWETPIDSKNQYAYGVPIKIFDKEEIKKMVKIAADYNLVLEGPLQLDCQEKVVHWREFNLKYTFLYLTMKKQ